VSRRLTVEADGGSRGNPGVAGYGALVRDTDSGALLAERAEPLGTASNNVAEYRGLLAGLEAAYAVDPAAEVHVRMDSKLVVEQMSGRWKIKHEDMRRLALQARDLVAGFTRAGGSVRFEWIPRAENKDADALSNVAMDGGVVDRTFGGPSAVDDVPGGPDSPDQGAGTEADEPPRRTGFDRRGTPTRVVLVRHGVTDFTAQGRLDGRGGPDPRLNATGRAQAVAAGRAVASLVQGHPARVVTSSLARAMETGAAVAAAIGVEPVVDAEWDEQSFGVWDGRSVEELVREEVDAMRALRHDATYRPPGGESHDDLVARVVPAWERVVAQGGTTVVVCHRKPILVVLAHLLGLAHDKAWRLAAAPGSLTAVEVWDDGEVSVAFTNRT
jgi:probable phosphoglycerate mutase